MGGRGGWLLAPVGFASSRTAARLAERFGRAAAEAVARLVPKVETIVIWPLGVAPELSAAAFAVGPLLACVVRR